MKRELIFILILATMAACGGQQKEQKAEEAEASFDGLREKATNFFGKLPENANSEKLAITPEKIELGKQLYFETQLSKDNTQSCNTCHNLNTYGVDNNSFSPGNDGGLGGRNSPTTLNAALHLAQFWDGREPDVEAQAGGPILNPVEMAMPSEEAVTKRLKSLSAYPSLFAAAFPDDQEPVTYENLKKAIGAFERQLITPGKFDDFLDGDDNALSTQQKEGLESFISAGCITCHAGNLFGGAMYQKFGLMADYWEYTNSETIDLGRYELTKNEVDKYMFKVPSLRNIEKTFPYFHDGSVSDLKKSIEIMAKVQLNKELSQKEIDDIAEFLKSLTGEVPEEFKM